MFAAEKCVKTYVLTYYFNSRRSDYLEFELAFELTFQYTTRFYEKHMLSNGADPIYQTPKPTELVPVRVNTRQRTC